MTQTVTILTQAVPVFDHKVAQFVCFSLLAWIVQVHNISMDNLTCVQRDEANRAERWYNDDDKV